MRQPCCLLPARRGHHQSQPGGSFRKQAVGATSLSTVHLSPHPSAEGAGVSLRPSPSSASPLWFLALEELAKQMRE